MSLRFSGWVALSAILLIVSPAAATPIGSSAESAVQSAARLQHLRRGEADAGGAARNQNRATVHVLSWNR